MKIKFLIFLAAMVTAAAAVDHNDGGRPGAFALMAADGRTAALGGAGVALAGFPAVYYNPAALATAEKDTIASTYRGLSLERRIVQLGYGRPILEGSGLGVSWTNAGAGTVEGRTISGNPTENVANSQNLFIFGFARPVGVAWAQAGVTGRFYYEVLGDGSATGYGVDVGVRASPWEWVTVGAAARDLATRLRWSVPAAAEPLEENVPTRALVGATLKPWPKLLFAAQGDAGRGEDWRLRAGAEVWADERLALRAGYDDGAPTLGAAVVLPHGGFDVTFDYAFVEEGFTGDGAHTASLTMQF